MKTTLAHLLIPPKWGGEPSWIERNYPARTFDFDTAERAASGLKHRALFVAVGAAKQRFRCACSDDELEVMVRLREPSPYLAVMPGTSLKHDPDCAFHRAPILSHVSDAITEQDDGSLRVRLNFRVGLPVPPREPAEILNEAPLRARQVQRQLNRFGLEGLLRLLFREAGLHRWRPWYRPEDRVTAAGSWKPSYARLLKTLGRIDAQGRRRGTLKDYTRIGVPAPYDPGTLIAWVDVIEKVEPPKSGHYWKCHVAGWTGKRNYLLISPAQVEVLLGQLRFHPERIRATLAQKLTAQARPGEVWWGCLLVRVEKGDDGKWCRVLDQGVLRTDRRGIPAESLDEIEMTQQLIDRGRWFCKPLLAGELEAVPRRRPDFILEDTAAPCCIEVAGMADVYDYNDRDDERLGEYDKAGVDYKRWQRTDPPLVLFLNNDTAPNPTARYKKTGRVNG
jgi:hypothetical protein